MSTSATVEATPLVAAEEHDDEIVIEPPGRFGGLNVRELWQYRELMYFLVKIGRAHV